MSVKVCVTCRLDGENQRDFVSALSESHDIELAIITDSYTYPSIPNLNQQQIYHYRPSWYARPFVSRYNPIDKREYLKILREINPDILLSLGSSKLKFISTTSGFKPAIFLPMGGETSKARGNPYWTNNKLNLLYYKLLYRPLYSELISHVDEVWSAKPNFGTFEEFGINRYKFRSFDWGVVDTDKFIRYDDSINFGEPGHTIIGSFRRARGKHILPSYEALMDGIGELYRRRDDFHVVLGGMYKNGKSDKINKLISIKISEHDLNDKVTILKIVPKSKMPRYLSGLDIYVNLTHKNIGLTGLGTSSKEAMACECAFVTFDNPPKDYIINDMKNGVLIPHDNKNVIAKKLEYLVENRDRCKKYGSAAREIVLRNYSVPVVSEKAFRSILEVLKSHG